MNDYNNNETNEIDEASETEINETPAPDTPEEPTEAEPIEAEPLSGETWSDAGYIPSEDASAVPRSYHYSAAPEEKEVKAKKVRAHRRLPRAAVAAICIVCAVAGAAAATFAPRLWKGTGTPEPEPTASAIQSFAAAADSGENQSGVNAAVRTLPTTAATAGEELTPTELYYNLAVNQVVGITGSVNYRYYGRTYSSTVSGSGFIISSDGYIMTNSHVIVDAAQSGGEIKVLLYDGSEYTATVVGYDEDNDIGVLKIDAADLMPVTIGDSDSLLVGETVYVVGNAMGYLEWSLTSGLVSGKDREITAYGLSNGGSETIVTFQTEATINSGNSGGPVYNNRGEVVGVAVASASSSSYAESLNFAIPINTAVAIAKDLIEDGAVSGKPYIGIYNADTLSATYAQYYGVVPGVYFQGLEAGGPAERAGLQVGDIIVGLGDHEIANTSDLESAKRDFHAGDTTTIRVYRSGQYLDLEITLGDMNDAADVSAPTATEEPEPTESGNSYYDYFSEFIGGLNPFGR